jgi:O-antigen/teichoic acid export membrane protein
LRSVLFGMGHVRGPALIYLAEALANLVLSLLLCRPLGVLGVALGTAIPILIFELGIILPYGLRHLQIPGPRFVCDALLPQLLPLGCLLCYAAYANSLAPTTTDWMSLMAITLGGGAVLGAGWLATALIERTWSRSRSLIAG